VDVDAALILAQRPPERPFDEADEERADLLIAVVVSLSRPGEVVDLLRDVACRLDRRGGGGVGPRLRDRSPALVSLAAIVGRKRRLEDEELRHGARREEARRNGLGRPERRLPPELDEGRNRLLGLLLVVDALLARAELEADRARAAFEEGDRRLVFGVAPGFHPRVGERLIEVVDPEPRGVVRLDDQLVAARLRSPKRPSPSRGEAFASELLGNRLVLAEVESHLGIEPVDDALAITPGLARGVVLAGSGRAAWRGRS